MGEEKVTAITKKRAVEKLNCQFFELDYLIQTGEIRELSENKLIYKDVMNVYTQQDRMRRFADNEKR